jgi:hypothetical protein
MFSYLFGFAGASGFGSGSKAEDIVNAYPDRVTGKVSSLSTAHALRLVIRTFEGPQCEARPDLTESWAFSKLGSESILRR